MNNLKRALIVFDFIQMNVPAKVAKGRNVLIDMNDNPNFTSPDVGIHLTVFFIFFIG